MDEEKITKYFKLFAHFKPDNEWRNATKLSLKKYMNEYPISRPGFSLGAFFLFRQYRFAAGALVLIFVLTTGGGVAWASQETVPGDLLWPVKITAEEIQKLLALDDVKKAELHMKFAEERLDEATELIEAGTVDEEHLLTALTRFTFEVKSGEDLVVKLEERGGRGEAVLKLALRLEDNLSSHQEVLDLLMRIVPEVARPALERAKEASARGEDVALKIVVKTDHKSNATEVKIKLKVEEGDEGEDENGIADGDEDPSLSITGARHRAEGKIGAVEHKLDEVKKHIERVRERLGDDRVKAAEAELFVAATCLEDAKKLFNEEKFIETFDKAQDCIRIATKAKFLLKGVVFPPDQDGDDEGDEDEDAGVEENQNENNQEEHGDDEDGEEHEESGSENPGHGRGGHDIRDGKEDDED